MAVGIAIELAAAACIASSGAPGILRRRPGSAGQSVATALQLIGSGLGVAGLAVHARGGGPEWLVLGPLPVGRAAFGLDGLSALFLVPMLLVSALGSLYGGSYWREAEHPENGRRLRLSWGIMTASMMAVVLARDAILFLIAWELMALSAFFLICTEQERGEVRQAGWIYLVATHAGTLCLVAFFSLLARAQGGSQLWTTPPLAAGSGLATALFALGIAGFGLKAGLMPLHVWLPGAHANAPSHVSALLSGVLLKTGVYGVVRVCGLLSEPPLWWGATILGMGALSGVLGIALALAQQDLKRLLAYSSIENMGIIAIGVGLACIGRSAGRSDLIALGLGGALLHALNHSLMKPLLFLAAGSVLHATGTREISALGGLGRAMPRTAALFALGAVAICGLPPLNGFAGELLLYVGVLHAAIDPAGGRAWAALAAPALAMIGALAVAAFVKVTGIAFGGTARSPEAARGHDPGRGMLAPMLGLAGACVLLGLVPGAALPLLRSAVGAWDPLHAGAATDWPLRSLLASASAAGLGLLACVALVTALLGPRRSAPATAPTWDCGYAKPTSRMQYGSASFSEILVGLFDWALQSRRAWSRGRGLFPEAARFESAVPDVVLERAVQPLWRAADRALTPLRALQRGPVQMYLLYLWLAIVALLLVPR